MSFVTNPAVLTIEGGLTLGIVAADVVKHIGESLSMRSATQLYSHFGLFYSRRPTGELFPHVCKLMLTQQSFYPLFPSIASLHPSSAQQTGEVLDATAFGVDYTQILALKMPFTPDVLLLPSSAKEFVRVCTFGFLSMDLPTRQEVEGAVCINPRSLSGGRFVQICVSPPRPSSVPTPNCAPLKDRLRVDICKFG